MSLKQQHSQQSVVASGQPGDAAFFSEEMNTKKLPADLFKAEMGFQRLDQTNGSQSFQYDNCDNPYKPLDKLIMMDTSLRLEQTKN